MIFITHFLVFFKESILETQWDHKDPYDWKKETEKESSEKDLTTDDGYRGRTHPTLTPPLLALKIDE